MTRYQLLPPLSEEEYAALRDDIRGAGVRVPIDVDEQGNILDGHHRKQIADELGKECPERVVRDLPEFAKVDYALTVNLTRRHLDKEGRKALVTKSLKRDPRLSDREHARRCGVSNTYVSGVREALEAAEQLSTSDSRIGKDGRERQLPTAQTAGVAAPAPDGGQATTPSGTAAAGDMGGPPAAAQEPVLPGRTGVGAPENSSHVFSGEETGPSAGTEGPAPTGFSDPAGSSAVTGEPAPDSPGGSASPPGPAGTSTAGAGPIPAPVVDTQDPSPSGLSGEEAGASAANNDAPAPDPETCRTCGQPLPQ